MSASNLCHKLLLIRAPSRITELRRLRDAVRCNSITKVITIVGTSLALLHASASAQLSPNTVHVESKTVTKNNSSTIGIFIGNQVSLRLVQLPLVFRSVTEGSFLTDFTANYSDNPNSRLHEDAYLTYWRGRYPYGNENGNCKQNQPGGFHDGPNDFVSPDAFLFTRFLGGGVFDPLPPGSDWWNTDTLGKPIPSMTIDLTVNDVAGLFEIDTTCADPANHLLFQSYPDDVPIVPHFTKGLIEIVDQDSMGVWPRCGCADPLPRDSVVTSPFGPRYGYAYHDAIDIRNSDGDTVFAILDGTVRDIVRNITPSTDYGWYMTVESDITRPYPGAAPKSVMALYHHMREPDPDTVVFRGTPIGITGHFDVAPHIHLETWPDADRNRRAHPLRYLPRDESGCPNLDPGFDPSNPDDSNYTLYGLAGAYDSLKCRSLSPRDDRYDLVAIDVWVYSPNLQYGAQAVTHFENDYPNLGSSSRTLFAGTEFEVEIRLDPLNMNTGNQYHKINIMVNPLNPFPSLDWIGVCLQDVSSEDCSGSVCALGSQMAAGAASVCPCLGNITGESPGLLLDFFDGYRTSDGVELIWRGTSRSKAFGVHLYRAEDGATLEPLPVGLLPFRAEEGTDSVLFIDRNADSTKTLVYEIAVQYEAGHLVFSGDQVVIPASIATNEIIPDAFSLGQNFPNPFNSATRIQFTVGAADADGPVRVDIFDVLGRRVATPFSIDIATPGQYEITWNGRDANDQDVASGVYFYRLVSKNGQIARKMVLLK